MEANIKKKQFTSTTRHFSGRRETNAQHMHSPLHEGTNAFFTFTVVLTNGAPWRAALAAVFLAAWVFVVLSLTGLRTLLVRLFPHGRGAE